MPLDDSMPADVEDFFKDSLVHLKKFLKVYEFQRNNRERLSKYQNEKVNSPSLPFFKLLIMSFNTVLVVAKTNGHPSFEVARDYDRFTEVISRLNSLNFLY